MARSVRRDAAGQLQGSTKDRFKAAVVKDAKQAGISERTVERVLSKGTANPKKPNTPRKKKPKIDTTDSKFVMKRLQRFMDFWSAEQHPAVKKICREFFN